MRRFTVRLIVVLGGLITLIALAVAAVVAHGTRVHLMTIDQTLHRRLADEVLKSHLPEILATVSRGGTVFVFERLMGINPNAEFYLLAANGAILGYSAPPGTVNADRVDTEPIELFISGRQSLPILGGDPRHPGTTKPFSAARITEGEKHVGYLYAVLGGDAYQSVVSMFRDSHTLRTTGWLLLGTLMAAFATGALAFMKLGGRLSRLAVDMRAFEASGFRSTPALAPSEGGGDEIDAVRSVYAMMARRISEQITELERIDASRRELLTHISHDLRTPLATLQAYLETLAMKSEELSLETRATFLSAALTFARKIDQLSSDLLELATLDLHTAPMKPEQFALAELLQDIVQRFGPRAGGKGIALDLSVATPGPSIAADIGLIERLFANLIDNAIKFTPAGGTIHVSVEEDGAWLTASVHDTGIGIPAAEKDRIFERFHRVPTPSARTDGSGLGLAIAKRIVELHRGTIGVESTPGHGTTFSVRLPRDH